MGKFEGLMYLKAALGAGKKVTEGLKKLVMIFLSPPLNVKRGFKGS